MDSMLVFFFEGSIILSMVGNDEFQCGRGLKQGDPLSLFLNSYSSWKSPYFISKEWLMRVVPPSERRAETQSSEEWLAKRINPCGAYQSPDSWSWTLEQFWWLYVASQKHDRFGDYFRNGDLKIGGIRYVPNK
ncbi:hypothetical protein Tco_1457884 [Tanacetum coccineum]